ncbi:MAG: hypothetical protein KDA05_06375 [Phycisphaerales bacterium]|nr:hypothetical protein [Phycisphaerales bacterium]
MVVTAPAEPQDGPTPDDAGPADAAQPDLDLFGNAPRGRPDWSHRRGEPRMFALAWTVFLTLLATLILMRSAVGGRLDMDVYRHVLRQGLMAIITAIVVAWPLVRLSQARPRGGGALSAFKDLLIIVVPLQAVLWPQVLLAHWPVGVVAALSAAMSAWAVLVGAVIALALGTRSFDPDSLPESDAIEPPRTAGRTLAMSVVIGWVMLSGVAALVLDGALPAEHALGQHPAWWMMLSPHAGVNEITRSRVEFGPAAHVSPQHGAAVLAIGALALLAWLGALGREALSPRRQPPPGFLPEPVAPHAQAH